ncbi:MAG: formate dehydrogenase accessory sulfurtransferase FdhD [Alphaproteobacteria bacterium]
MRAAAHSAAGGRGPTELATALRLEDRHATTVPETVAVEAPVAFVYNGIEHAVMMATPTDVEDFAVGFTLAEGIVGDADEIASVAVSEVAQGVRLDVAIPDADARRLQRQRRNLAGRTGCGLCGVVGIDQALRALPALPPGSPVAAAAIVAALAALPESQVVNRRTGSVHAAAFAERDGTIVAVREDVGRHNALDKVIGAVARSGRDPAQGFVVITSRCSMEMVQKAATVGVSLLVAISAPTSLAIDLAEGCGLCLVAFARGESFNVYSHPERVTAKA